MFSSNGHPQTERKLTIPLVTVNGRRLYIEEKGPHDAPVLLYLHGGPGTGCYDFMHQQSDRLGQHLRLVALDQRGVLRSEPLAEDERLTLDDLLSDLEALRQHLHIERWSVLGHSFGGYLALLYAITYPESVERLIFENPTFDFHSSVRSLLSAAADRFTASGQVDLAAQCAQAIAAPSFTDELMQSFFHLMSALGDRRNSLYEHRTEANLFDTLVDNSGLPAEYWQRAQRHSQQIFAEGRLTQESLLPRLAEVACPALLLQGKYDSVTSPEQCNAFRESVVNGTVQLFTMSSHFVHLEEPDASAQAVLAFFDEMEEISAPLSQQNPSS
ncbi:MAG: alpha/beta hydrolase [Tumebacillaceae bacterium]